MKTLLLFIAAVLLCGCGEDFKTFDVEVEVVGSLPSIEPNEEASAVLYRVLSPAEVAGMYGVEFTALRPDEVESKKGMSFKIRRLGKFRHLLKNNPPQRASVSQGEDFFATAIPK
ncbi:MAG: hypothetical protein QM760_07530 [Nibricoccus sp.]